MNYQIVYNLSYSEELSTYLPAAFICSVSDDGLLEYMQKQASLEICKSYDLNINDHEALINLCQELSLSNIENKYSKNLKKKVSLVKLLEDELIRTQVNKWIDNKKNEFLLLIKKYQFPICKKIERKSYIQNLLLEKTDIVLTPKMFFRKTNEGINYKLLLEYSNEYIPLRQDDIDLICDFPAWIIFQKKLYQIVTINTKKLLPFLNKTEINIPERMVKNYFEKFIMEVISKVDCEVEGFEIKTSNAITEVQLKTTFDFIQEIWILEIYYNYDGVVFNYADLTSKNNKLFFDRNDQIRVRSTIRNRDTEMKYVNILLSFKLNEGLNKRFYIEGNQFQIFEWIRTNRGYLEKEFNLNYIQMDEGKVCTFPLNISFDTITRNDWFDIFGTVTIGIHEIPFTTFINHIRDRNRLYKLPDQTIFILPEEWFTKYDALSQYGIIEDNHVRIDKSQYTLIEKFNSIETSDIDNDSIKVMEDYIPSKNLKAELRPYQLVGVNWLISHYYNGLGACLADDMGLGKTLQTIALLLFVKESLEAKSSALNNVDKPRDLFSDVDPQRNNDFCSLFILPASLLFNWEQELRKFAPSFRVLNYSGINRKDIQLNRRDYNIILTSYQVIIRDFDLFNKINFDYVICDESQQFKNKDSKTFKILHQLKANNRISLSGTPIENSLKDLWSQMEFINPGILGTYHFFNKRYIQSTSKKHDGGNLDELKELIKPYILRRKKEEVLKELPELTEQIFYSEMSEEQNNLYEEEKSAARNCILNIENNESKNKFIILNSLLKLRQIANHPNLLDKVGTYTSGKFEDIKAYLSVLIQGDHKVLIFSSFTSHLELLANWLESEQIKYLSLTGNTKVSDREHIVDQFQNQLDIKLFLISIKAGGVGLNLTSASYIVIMDPWWNPYTEKQAISRAHRMGQSKPVHVMRFITKNSIEQKIILIQKDKLSISEELLEMEEMPSWISEHLTELID
ncbi:MAG: ATP-dependent helicase [Saprospiraceae bacterium]|nr:ATP-dependent helicase [Candidatus Defluviibacterium haderslevense]